MKKKLLIIFCILIILAIALCIYLYNTLDAFRPYNFSSEQRLMIAERTWNIDGNALKSTYYLMFDKKDKCTSCFIETEYFDETKYFIKHMHRIIKEVDGIQYSEYTAFNGRTLNDIKSSFEQDEHTTIKEF